MTINVKKVDLALSAQFMRKLPAPGVARCRAGKDEAGQIWDRSMVIVDVDRLAGVGHGVGRARGIDLRAVATGGVTDEVIGGRPLIRVAVGLHVLRRGGADPHATGAVQIARLGHDRLDARFHLGLAVLATIPRVIPDPMQHRRQSQPLRIGIGII